MFRALSVLLAGLVLAWTNPVFAQITPSQPARDRSQTAGYGTGVIRGRILDAASGRGLPRAEVRAGPNAPQFPDNRIVLTDGDGRYEIKGLPAETFVINVSKPNYVRAAWGAERVEGPGKRILLADGQVLEKIDVRLARAGVITGKIVDEFGDPVTDVSVTAMHYQYIQGSRRLTQAGRGGGTNDIGEYAPMYYPGTENAAQAQRVTLAAGQELSDIVMSLKPLRATKISGTVVTSDGRQMGGFVMVLSTAGFGFSVSSGGPIRPDGTFTVNGLAPGEYTMRAQSGGMPSDDTEIGIAKITATGDDITDLRIVAAKPSTLSGRIVSDPAMASAMPPTLQLMLSPIDPGTMPMGIGPIKMGGDGTFEMKSGPGRMRINVMDAAGWTIRSVRLNGTDITDTGIEFKASEDISGVEIELTNKLTVVSGLVTNARGESVKDYSAIAFTQDRDKWKGVNRYQGAGRPDQDGRFKISGLPPGDYYVIALDRIEPGQSTDPDFLETIRIKATAFTIREGETRTVDLKINTAS